MHKHLSPKIENSKLFRLLFLIRKLWLIKSSRRYFSQHGEDIALGSLVDLKSKGFYVDVGCFHPKKYSNTYRLYKNGWNGINIDMDEIKIQGFNICRPRDENIACAITNEKTESITMYSFGFYALISTLDENFAKKRKNYKKKEVPATTLEKIFSEREISKVDVLSVDAEGYDINVLKSINFNSCEIEIILVEEHKNTLDEILITDTYNFLHDKGYTLVNWTGPTLIFRKQS